MKQLIQNVSTGEVTLADVPAPGVPGGGVLVRTSVSLVSAGTERMMLAFGRANWIDKARQQPDKVRMVLDKARTDGLAATIDAVRSKLDEPLAPGYCNVGVVVGVGAEVQGFAPGDRVLSNGRHAEYVAVPRNLCARVPDAVPDEHAAFAVLGAIGLQGLRLAAPTIGECVVVTGLGLIGLLTVQMLRANGCRVMGIDVSPARLELARRFGAEVVVDVSAGEDPIAAAARFSRGRGVDAVLLTLASASSEPVSQAATMCRKRGRIVLVGVTGLELSRADFYEKELSFQVSCSYGPGRYDPLYEERGQDYPLPFVRWTEQRNFEAVLDLMASGALDVAPLLSHRFAFKDAPAAYDVLGGDAPSLGILLDYRAGRAETVAGPDDPAGHDASPPPAVAPARSVALPAPAALPAGGAPALAVLGAGNYAGRVLIPAFREAGARLDVLVSAQGVSASHHGRRHGFRVASTDAAAAIATEGVSAVVVATRHDLHAAQAVAALGAGRHVFVEKPLCLTLDELERIRSAYAAANAQRPTLVMVGFNRRFAPHVVAAKSLLASIDAPKSIVIVVNAGQVPAGHWTLDPAVGGGRLVGEACHFIDLARHLAGAPIARWHAQALPGDGATISLAFADGSAATIHYVATGHRAVPKERIEVHCAGRSLRIDNFRRLALDGWPGRRAPWSWRQDKGQCACAAAFVSALCEGGNAPISFDEIVEVSRIAIEVQAAVSVGQGGATSR